MPENANTTPANTPEPARLAAQQISLSYDRSEVISDLSVTIPPGSFTVIIGPNA